MKAVILHGKSGDVFAIVSEVEELRKTGIKFVEVHPQHVLVTDKLGEEFKSIINEFLRNMQVSFKWPEK
jgi:hypothetical protein